MARMYKTINGMPIGEYVKSLPGVQERMAFFAKEVGTEAELNLERVRDDSIEEGRYDWSGGHSRVVVRRGRGKSTWQVVLDDRASDKAANIIELGRRQGGYMRGFRILRRAAQTVGRRHGWKVRDVD